jgi:hypothetical protein
VNLVVLPERKGFIETILDAPGGRHGGHGGAAPGRPRLLRWVTSMTRGDVSARLPFDLRVF